MVGAASFRLIRPENKEEKYLCLYIKEEQLRPCGRHINKERERERKRDK